MRVVDRDKERERNIVRNDVKGLVIRVTQQSNIVHQLVADLTFVTSGTPSGRSSLMVSDCQQTILQISRALQSLEACRRAIEKIDITEEDDDD